MPTVGIEFSAAPAHFCRRLRPFSRNALLLCLLLAGTSQAVGEDSPDVPRALHDYVARPEPSFAWTLRQKIALDQGAVYDLELTSQEWQGIVWKHQLQVFEPGKLQTPGHVLLFVTGGSNGSRPGADSVAMGLKLAELTGARVATLHQVPNQPLFDGRKEDDLITETWLRYLETGDPSWPLLFPMVKSAVKAMDAVEQLAEREWNQKLAGFVITGASKRGWTSWLTPVADSRIIATAPIVIDVLNFRAQMKHQKETWGKYSEQIDDYTRKGLIKEGDESPREALLRQMMDPYTYRAQLKLPKLIINGANDRYWQVDATQFYWHDLAGEKSLLVVPNAGHGLDGGRDLALSTLAAFFRHVVQHRAMPELKWEFANGDQSLILRLQGSAPPRSGRLWVARSDSRDFRDSRWNPEPLREESGVFVGQVARPTAGHVALFGELQYSLESLPYSLCTLIRAE